MPEESELILKKNEIEEIRPDIIVEAEPEPEIIDAPEVTQVTKKVKGKIFRPAVFEWVVWFRDGTLLSQYDVNGAPRKYQHVTIYAEQISPIKRVGWLPISAQKRQKVNYLAQKEIVESINLNAVFVELHDGEEVFFRKRHAITIPLSSTAPKQTIETFYIAGAGNRFLAVDSDGNVRMDNHSNIAVPVIPPEAADQKITPEIVEEIFITGGEEPAATKTT